MSKRPTARQKRIAKLQAVPLSDPNALPALFELDALERFERDDAEKRKKAGKEKRS
jgi:hypothetical protein